MMANIRLFKQSFVGGEISPEMMGRIEDAKYPSGLSVCRNFIIKPQGVAENRGGFRFIREVKDSSKKVRLIPFSFSIEQTLILEFGDGYIRFYTNGGVVLQENSNEPYEIASPYTEADLFDLHYVQSADILTIVHKHYPPKELRRYAPLDWRLEDVVFNSKLLPPNNVEVVQENSGSSKYQIKYSYVVTAFDDHKSESQASDLVEITNDLFTTGCTNKLTWNQVEGATRYNVYKHQNGMLGYIGQTDKTSFVDNNIAPDMSATPPINEVVFKTEDNYPSAVAYFQQRRVFAGTTNQPQNIWMTKSGTESDMSYTIPTRDDNRISFRIAAREANYIQHIVPMAQLLLLTSSAEWAVNTITTDALTPSSISVMPQSYIGANNVQPIIVNNSMIYCAARGGHVREMSYSREAGGYISSDLSLRTTHLFDGYDIVDMAYSKAPIPIVWMVSSSGQLIGNTYIPEHQINAWHRHDTQNGVFESCAVVSEGREDVLYVVVKRRVNQQEVRYIERLESRAFRQPQDCFIVDSGLSYSGRPVIEVGGLEHLEGEVVSILGDGAVHPQQKVINGAVKLNNHCSIIHVGLPIQADIQTNPVAMQVDSGMAQGRMKNINKAWLKVWRSSGIFLGPSPDLLVEAKQRTTEHLGLPPTLKSEEIEMVARNSWNDSGQVYIRQNDPLPLTLVSLTTEVAIGG